MIRTQARAGVVAGTVLIVGLWGAGAAWAQAEVNSHAVVVNRFAPLVAPTDLTIVASGGVLPHLTVGVGLFLDYERNPLKLFVADSSNDLVGLEGIVVGDQLQGDLVAAVGLFDRLQVGLDFPFMLYQNGLGIDDMGRPVPGGGVAAHGVGDLRLGVRARAWEGDVGKAMRVTVGGGLEMTLPTGDEKNFLGEKSVVGGGFLAAGLVYEHKVEAALSAGYRVRAAPVVLFNAAFNDEIFYGAAVGYRVLEKLRVSAALTGYLGGPLRGGASDAPGGDLDQSPLELDGFVDWWMAKDLMLTAGGGAGLRGGVGAPDVRGVLGVRWAPSVPGLAERLKSKADDGEGDVGGVGKSYTDDDGDGIPNRDDLCPKEAEDADKFDDEDGCPELDNDRDGLPDAADACPNAAEDKDGVNDSDGCPDVDDDGDGVFNDADKCPGALEDIDGVADEDGCPDPDNDLDCIPDTADKCPDEAEVLNGVSDMDGCADSGDTHYFIDKDSKKIAALDSLAFAGKTAALEPAGLALLEELAGQLRVNAWIKKLRVEVGVKGDAKKLVEGRVEAVSKALADLGAGARVTIVADKKKAPGSMLLDVVEADAAALCLPKVDPGVAPALAPVAPPAPGAAAPAAAAARAPVAAAALAPAAAAAAAPAVAAAPAPAPAPAPALVVPPAAPPAAGPAGLAVLDGDLIQLAGKVDFFAGKAKLTKTSSAALEDVAALLVAHSELTKLRVEGHVGGKGKHDKLVKLSAARAAEVLKFLVAHGVDAARLDATGWGPDRPLLAPEAKGAAAANSRVEIVVLERGGAAPVPAAASTPPPAPAP
ncbi:MAG TPA: OmpA family protein [Myxococcota bacterium]|nr:OmpA family protein [Myxococcota bacterium]